MLPPTYRRRVPTALASGLALGFSLIIAIGAQNLFVLRQGIRREHPALVAGICAASDAVLIVLGVAGVGHLLTAVPWLDTAARWGGAAFLLVYGILAARRAIRPSARALQVADADRPSRSRAWPIAGTTLALTWLNPHVYLDTVFLLGTIASAHGDARWWFAVGAIVASFIWFASLAFGARALGRCLRSPVSWRVLDGVVAVIMIAIAVGLVLPR